MTSERVTFVCLVRHGETDWNAQERMQGRTDTDLTAEGLRQARCVAECVVGLPHVYGFDRWSALYTSPLKRTLRTAEEIGQRIGLEPVTADGLVERSFGAIEGLKRSEIELEFPGWHDHPERVAGLEPRESVERRAIRAIDEVVRLHEGGALVVVSHGALLNAFLSATTAGLQGAGTSPLTNCGYTLLTRTSLTWHTRALNVTDHLTPAE